jgi:preprotein translocase subunit SecG
MKGTLLLLQLLSAVALIVTVLLHSAKGEGLGGIGGTARIFGTQKGLEEGLNKLTTGCAVAFLAISILLGMLGA